MASEKFLVRNLAGFLTEIFVFMCTFLSQGPYRAPMGSGPPGRGAGRLGRARWASALALASARLRLSAGFRLSA